MRTSLKLSVSYLKYKFPLAKLYKDTKNEVSFFFHHEKAHVKVGSWSYGKLHVYAYQRGGSIIIGKFTSIGEVCLLMGGNHHQHLTTYSLNGRLARRDAGVDMLPIKNIEIGNDVWIGFGVTILDGVTIGDGAIVGAQSVVTKSIPPYAVAIGNPAKVIRYRFGEDDVKQLLKSKWWENSDDYILEIREKLYGTSVDELIKEMKK